MIANIKFNQLRYIANFLPRKEASKGSIAIHTVVQASIKAVIAMRLIPASCNSHHMI